MKQYKTRLLFILLIFLGGFGKIISQCNLVQEISVCDMTTVDFDTDGNPDGIINLYDEYTTATGLTIQNGTWSVNPRFSISLDPNTGNVSLWSLERSTEVISDYTFELRNMDCGDDVALTIRLILGPYSGVALPPFGINNVNVETCDTEPFDLYNALISNDLIPPPHLNGEWTYNGTSPSFISISGSELMVEIPYQPGLPLVDQEVFEFTYEVPGISPCALSMETTVRVSVVREVDAGTGAFIEICEEDILAGVYDLDIDLRDDTYLEDEDIEGFWSSFFDPTNQISDVGDSTINIKEIYENIIDGGNNLDFGCESFVFRYTVEQRSGVCMDQFTDITFRIHERLKPFQQINSPVELCPNSGTQTLRLFNLLEFTNQNGVDFIYDNYRYVQWRLVSGPSDLNLNTTFDDPDKYLGRVSYGRNDSGTYVFEYAVHPSINCPNSLSEICFPFSEPDGIRYCEPYCSILTTQVTIQILGVDYPGEDTDGLNFCETEESVDLRSLLRTNGFNTIVTTGVWTNNNGDVIDNTFVFPEIDNQQTFTFTYSTASDDGCADSANLSFTIFKEANAGAGSGTSTTLCSDDLTVTLFELLEGDPDTTGIWTGPFGYTSMDHLGVFDASDDTLPILGPGDYVYTVGGNIGCSAQDQTTVSIAIVEPIEIGNDRNETFCKIDGRVNLYSLLDSDTVRTGVFEDTDNTEALSPDGVLEFETLTNGIFNFRYVVVNALPCDESSLNVAVQIVDLPEPNVPDQEFCILDGKRLDDIEVDVLNYNWYANLESDMPIIDNPLLFDNQVYYIATVDADNCESERVTVAINILNMGERFSNGDLCSLDFQDGVSPDGNNQNDTFDLFVEDEFNIPVAFPDFDLKIYNRYGATVYEGNRNTGEFRGESNVSIRLGDDLPSGTYFYIFTPNFENNFPIQGSFYLSR
ncbi:T9SS type B sorting domain-containing protein [Aquimarina sp. 2201CG14-23]|uniref:T9SS type B sorting domain-containing protein n=1 Tax=Aquimarina mycalae TaxID=3040073 RepID=UPI0024781D7E|nr:gliding motility-associated C-terminal domain-containing protein [Aquimarina sp. 2201CG14-23]MDH7445691.1 gliding motility-associated C-terminal domain-containing protein [Aquimarina sp. 2201CG14-23]